MENYKLATQQKARFQTKRGLLSTEQLWDLSLNELDELAVSLENEYKESGKKSFLVAKSVKDKTTKLKFGHRGCNHPVKDLEANIVHITSQNHGYVVEELPDDMEVTHVNINDGTVEGMKHKTLPIYSVQFHPEASAGPKDSEYIFDKFLEYAL